MSLERTPEQRKEAVREIYDGLEGGIYEDRSRFSLQVEDPGRFLENYARIGQIKEHISEKVLRVIPESQSSVKQTNPKEKVIRGEVVILPGNKEFYTVGKMKQVLEQLIKASKENATTHSSLVNLIYEEEIAVGKTTNENAKNGIDRILTRLRVRLQTEVQLTVTNVISASDRFEGKGAAYFLEEFSKPEQKINEPSIPVLPIEPIKPTEPILGTVYEYRVPENEIRTEEESKILSIIIRGVTAHNQLFFEDLQRELHQFHEAELPVYIYSSRELNQKFIAAYKKLEREFKTPRRQQMWTEEDRAIWDRIERRVSEKHEGDIEKFKRSIRQYIVNAERDFNKKFQQG